MTEYERLPDIPGERHKVKMAFEEGLMLDPELTHFQRVVGLLIVRHWNEKDASFAGAPRLGKMALVKGKPATRQGVGKAVDKLEERGWFHVEGRGKTGDGVSLRYHPRWSRGRGWSVPDWKPTTQTADYVSAAPAKPTRKLQNAEQVNCRTPDTETAGYPNLGTLTSSLNTGAAVASPILSDEKTRRRVRDLLWSAGIDGELTVRECLIQFHAAHGEGPNDDAQADQLLTDFIAGLARHLPAHDQRNMRTRLDQRGEAA